MRTPDEKLAPKSVRPEIRDCVKLPKLLRVIGEASTRNGTDKMTSREIDEVIKEARAAKKASSA